MILPYVVLLSLILFIIGIYVGVSLEFKYRSNNQYMIQAKESQIRKLENDNAQLKRKVRKLEFES